MTIGTRITISHGMRFAAVLAMMCVVPAYSLTHLPIAMIIATVCEMGVIIACAVGAGVWIAKFVRVWNSRLKTSLRPGRVTIQLILTICFVLLCIGRIVYRPSYAALMLVMVMVIALCLGGGAWVFGCMLQWLWRVTTPHNGLNQESGFAHGGARVTRS